jgi:hypothetical protein
MKENENSSRSRAPHFLRRNWYWIVFITIPLLAAAILISLPYGIDYAAEQWLMSHGLEVARVEDVDFNPFTGTLVLRNLQAKIGESQVLRVPEAKMRIYWLPFFNKRAHIEKLSIKDTTVIIDHDEKGRWRIGGLALAAAAIVADKPAESAWGFSLNQLEGYHEQTEELGQKASCPHRLGGKDQRRHIESEGRFVSLYRSAKGQRKSGAGRSLLA